MNVRTMVEATKRRQVVDFHPSDRLGLIAGVRLQLVVEAQGVVEFLQFVGNDRPRRTPGLLGVTVLLQDTGARRGDQAMTIHAKTRGR